MDNSGILGPNGPAVPRRKRRFSQLPAGKALPVSNDTAAVRSKADERPALAALQFAIVGLLGRVKLRVQGLGTAPERHRGWVSELRSRVRSSKTPRSPSSRSGYRDMMASRRPDARDVLVELGIDGLELLG